MICANNMAERLFKLKKTLSFNTPESETRERLLGWPNQASKQKAHAMAACASVSSNFSVELVRDLGPAPTSHPESSDYQDGKAGGCRFGNGSGHRWRWDVRSIGAVIGSAILEAKHT